MNPNNATRWKLLLMMGLFTYLALSSLDVTSFSQGPENRNVSVGTRVNITNAIPLIEGVFVYEAGQSPSVGNVTLSAGGNTTVFCNATVSDFNGGSTITLANATLYDFTNANSGDPEDNNTHYTNGSCSIVATGGYYRNFSCSFQVEYYANAGTWECNVTVQDDHPFNLSRTNTTTIDALLALNVTTLIDYGNLAVFDISQVQQANVTNVGNVDINVSVYGLGGYPNQTQTAGLAFVCEFGSIDVEWEKYNVTDNGQNPDQYFNLSSTPSAIPGLTVVQQTNDSQQSDNTTHWLLEVPPNPFGECNGTVVFQAELAS